MDPDVLNKILGCFYGIPMEINEHEEFYEIYETLYEFGIEDLLNLLHQFLIQSENLPDILIGT